MAHTPSPRNTDTTQLVFPDMSITDQARAALVGDLLIELADRVGSPVLKKPRAIGIVPPETFNDPLCGGCYVPVFCGLPGSIMLACDLTPAEMVAVSIHEAAHVHVGEACLVPTNPIDTDVDDHETKEWRQTVQKWAKAIGLPVIPRAPASVAAFPFPYWSPPPEWAENWIQQMEALK